MMHNIFSLVQYHWFFIYFILLRIKICCRILDMHGLSSESLINSKSSNHSCAKPNSLIILIYTIHTYIEYFLKNISDYLKCIYYKLKPRFPRIKSQLSQWYPWFISFLRIKWYVVYFHQPTSTYQILYTSIMQFK